MDEHQHHEELIEGLYKQLKPIFDSSHQAVYVYLDDIHKICNERFSSLLGYASAQDWVKVTEPFADTFVDEKSQEKLVTTFQNAMEKMVASKVDITWKTKDGNRVATSVILAPISYNGHLFALHFISEVQKSL